MENNQNQIKKYYVEKQELISLEKFLILSFLTFGLYCVWWIYKEWRFFNQKENLDIMPALRAILSIIFIYPLFNKILKFAKERGFENGFQPFLLSFGFISFQLFSNISSYFEILSFLSLVFLIQPYQAMFFAKFNSPELEVIYLENYNSRQLILIILGSIFWLITIMAYFIGIK